MKYQKKLDKKIKKMIDNYENGNKQDFRNELKKFNAYETAKLITRWQPYHNAIAKIEISYENTELSKKLN